ncbi:MAG: Helix-turn-helix domain protein [bacterium ADurb.Bin243]|nr:MAG: Helix-turn-helix domain protein [bacterium ADurb.Bin243]
MNFGQKLKIAISDNNITQKELANGTGLHVNTINYYISGAQKNPDHASIEKICTFMNLPKDYFDTKIPENYYAGVGKRIKEFRIIKGINAEEFIDGTELSLNELNDVESGVKNVSKLTLYRFQQKWNVNMTWLLTGKGDPVKTTFQNEENTVHVLGNLTEGLNIIEDDIKSSEEIMPPMCYLKDYEKDKLFSLKVGELSRREREYFGLQRSDYIIFLLDGKFIHKDIIVMRHRINNSLVLKKFNDNGRLQKTGVNLHLFPESPKIETCDVFMKGLVVSNSISGGNTNATYEYLGRVVFSMRIYQNFDRNNLKSGFRKIKKGRNTRKSDVPTTEDVSRNSQADFNKDDVSFGNLTVDKKVGRYIRLDDDSTTENNLDKDNLV